MKFHIPLIVSLLSSPLALAQSAAEAHTEVSTQSQFWEAKLPGGSCLIHLGRISSVSMHSYTVKGAIVHEIAIDTLGSGLTRIYAMEPIGQAGSAKLAQNLIQRSKELGKQTGDKVGLNPNTTVHKEYPLTTHAKTIEFRLADKRDLDQVYKSLTTAWSSGLGRKITIR